MSPQILLVDDEAPLRSSLAYAFGREGFEVQTAADGAAALAEARRSMPDVVVLDLALPDVDGLEVCRQLRSACDVPVVMLTARDQADDRLRGFDCGADDYVTKPFNTRELVARVRALLRRRAAVQQMLEEDRALLARLSALRAALPTTPGEAGPQSDAESAPLRLEDGGRVLELVPARRVLVVDGRVVALDDAECRLLAALVRERGRVATRTALIDALWGVKGPEAIALLEAHVRVLRDKLERDPARPEILLSVPGIGYRLAFGGEGGAERA